jgi:hypothetical protein
MRFSTNALPNEVRDIAPEAMRVEIGRASCRERVSVLV